MGGAQKIKLFLEQGSPSKGSNERLVSGSLRHARLVEEGVSTADISRLVEEKEICAAKSFRRVPRRVYGHVVSSAKIRGEISAFLPVATIFIFGWGEQGSMHLF